MKGIGKVLIVFNDKKEHIDGIVQKLCSELKRRKISYQCVSPAYYELSNKDILTDFDKHYRHEDFDLIIPVGGDGTFLYTARTFLSFNIPIVGINGGRLGFLMAVNPDGIKTALDKIADHKAALEERVLLEARVVREGKVVYRLPFLNDAVVSKGTLSRMVEISVLLDGESLSQYRADGLIISTPTGSTAYNLAAGGPILTPDIDAVILSPICPHTLGIRPIVVGSSKELNIRLLSNEKDTTLTIDGQENFSLRMNDVVEIGKAAKTIKIYDCSEKQFFSVLREKMGWHL